MAKIWIDWKKTVWIFFPSFHLQLIYVFDVFSPEQRDKLRRDLCQCWTFYVLYVQIFRVVWQSGIILFIQLKITIFIKSSVCTWRAAVRRLGLAAERATPRMAGLASYVQCRDLKKQNPEISFNGYVGKSVSQSHLQHVSYKRYFQCNNYFLLLVYTINLSLKNRFGRPATDGKLLY